MPDVTLRISRYDPELDEGRERRPRRDEFVLHYDDSLTVLEALFAVRADLDSSLAFRYCCRASICGSCAMYINGRYRLACQTNLRSFGEHRITVDPLPHLPVIRDLVCDMTDFFKKYEQVMPWLIRRDPDPEKEILQSPKDRKKLDPAIDCILCGSCYSACPSAWTDEAYLGPAALLKAFRFEVDSRDQGGVERLGIFDNEHGAYRCHTITNCAEACPKELNPVEGVQWLKRAAVRHRLLGRFR